MIPAFVSKPTQMSVHKNLHMYGTSRTQIAYILQNYFFIEEGMMTQIKPFLAEYSLRYWDTEYLLKTIDNGMFGTYKIIWYRCTPSDLHKYKQARLSFRAAIPELNLPAFVLIQVLKSSSSQEETNNG